MRRLALIILALLPMQRLVAQTTIDVGVAVGEQSYESTIDDPRVLTSVELLARRGTTGVHLAAEYADLSEEGALFVIHPDLVYRWALGSSFGAMIGGGPTYANVGGSGGGLTWNAEVELEGRRGRTGIFARV